MQDNRIPRPMTEAEILRRRELRCAAIKKQQRRRTLFLTACGLAAVLGCTHYPFLRPQIRRVLGQNTEILDGADGTARETKRRLSAAGLLRQAESGSVELMNSIQSAEILERSAYLLEAEVFDEI